MAARVKSGKRYRRVRVHPAMRRTISGNRKAILTREAAILAQIAAAFTTARRTVQPSQQALLDAYRAALADAQAAATDDGEDDGDGSSARVPLSWLTSSGYGPRLERTVLLALAAFALTSRLHITEGQRQAARDGATDAQAALRTAFDPLLQQGVSLHTLEAILHKAPGSAIEALIGRSRTTGTPLAALLDRLGEPTASKLLQLLSLALTNGTNPLVAARWLSDAFDMAYNRAATICRTEMLTAYRSAGLETMRANSDVLDGWVWMAAGGACPFCASMDGTQHTMDEDLSAMTHPNCRCAMAPLPKPMSDLLDMFSGGGGSFLGGFIGGVAAGLTAAMMDEG